MPILAFGLQSFLHRTLSKKRPADCLVRRAFTTVRSQSKEQRWLTTPKEQEEPGAGWVDQLRTKRGASRGKRLLQRNTFVVQPSTEAERCHRMGADPTEIRRARGGTG